jgi:hypothetical protein
MNYQEQYMNYQEIKEKLTEIGIKTGDEIVAEFYEGGNIDEETLVAMFGDVEVIDEQGGYEGGGDYAMKVFLFKAHNIYIKVTGFYSSYNGTDWDGTFTEVFPQQKTITVYE